MVSSARAYVSGLNKLVNWKKLQEHKGGLRNGSAHRASDANGKSGSSGSGKQPPARSGSGGRVLVGV